MRVCILLLMTLTFVGCPEPVESSAPEADVFVEDVAPVEDSGGMVNDGGVTVPVVSGRHVHRMTIAQLARSIPVITGGIEWIEDFGHGPMDMLKILYATLGGPDFLLVTEENLDPSLIVAKFVQDAAYRICTMWVDRDRLLPADERTLIAHPDWNSVAIEDVNTSLTALQLRFFARKLDPQNDQDLVAIAGLRDLFFAAAAAAPGGQETDDGWTAVCLALMTAPEMVLY